MGNLTNLANSTGRWHGTSKLQDPQCGIQVESPSTATLKANSDNSYRLEYTWSYHDKPQSGSLQINLEKDQVVANWTDTWHTGNKPMACIGPPPAGLTVTVRGSYATPPGPDWGWRIDLAGQRERLRLVMWNVWPAEQGGKEDLAVEADYARLT